MPVNIALDHLRRQVVVDTHQHGAVIISRPPERARIKPSLMIGTAIVKACKLRVGRVIANLTLEQAVFIGQPDGVSHRDDKSAAFTQGKTPNFFME